MTITVVIATSGRPTLPRAIDSVLPQLADGDEILCVFDGHVPADFPARDPRVRLVADLTPLPSQYGNRQRNIALPLTRTDWYCFLDDDDTRPPNALVEIRAVAARQSRPLPMLFRMRLANGRVVWKQPELRRCNVGTGSLVIPNIPAQIPAWPVTPDPPGGVSPRQTDFNFITELARNFNGREFHSPVIYDCRPKG